ncbi:hypothetical protein ACHAWU_003084 [Discostella pseudostelligera]|uniref:Uncharacterized protein n=1 Tax=Discostella pseudostelligera TaxID=259834 RepID=A0ABD3MNQ9_9STRA
MEDPFVEFGKSSEQKSAGMGNGSTSNANASSSQLSFSDIAFPSTTSSPSTSSSTSSQEGGNLNNTLQNKQICFGLSLATNTSNAAAAAASR